MAIDNSTLPEHIRSGATRFIGKDVKRVEDPALVSGTVEFIDNMEMPGMLHCAILRSPHPHARVLKVDTSAAEALEGVTAVLTGEDAKLWTNPAYTAPEGWGAYCLAVDKVRFVGEPVAAVAADSRYIAEDALELIRVEYDLLPPLATPQAAMATGAPILFEAHGSNVVQSRIYNWGEVDRIFAEADHVVSNSFRWNRVGANPTETFGCIAQWDLAENSLTVHGSYQTPRFWVAARAMALNLASNKVRIVSHPMGGSFGGKGGPRGTDITALLSRKSEGRPVKYIEDRMEYLIAGFSQSWDRHYEAALAVKADGTVTGFKVRLIDDQGAGTEGWGTISVAKPLAAFTGPYRIEAAQYDTLLIATNRAPTGAYRGYGPPPHFLVLESLMDMTARKLGMDPVELRRYNYIRPEQFPYTTPAGNVIRQRQLRSGAGQAAGHGRLPRPARRADPSARSRTTDRHRRGEHSRARRIRLERLRYGWRSGIKCPRVSSWPSMSLAISPSSSVLPCRARANTPSPPRSRPTIGAWTTTR
ncbi:MAG: xanthine dehydrogenase family protein molybdopterin-binding subunit [Betaproteobacteria bacterium]|nr:xanthine dehydrogenase family protein molybdopterin-binding subunit [Betaproteobacteria bacterium]